MRPAALPLDQLASPVTKHSVRRAVNFFTRSHPGEGRGNIWFQVEAKAERSSNLIRFGYITIWVLSTLGHAAGNPFYSNVANLGWGGLWWAWCLSYQIYLLNNPYRSSFKYLSTTIDMFIITAMLFTYQYTAGPAYALKVPTFYNYFCCLGLAALRYRLHLAIYGGVVAVVLYCSLLVYFITHYDMKFGTGVEYATTEKLNEAYIIFNVVYLMVVTFLIYFLVYNVKRLVNIRVREGESALKAKERAMIAANVAHEIKNPLEGIYGAAQLLKEEGKGNGKFIDMILKDAVRLNGVVTQFLQFSRPFQVHMSDFDAVEAIQRFCREQISVLGENKLCLEIRFPNGESVSSDKNQMPFPSTLPTLPIHADSEGLNQILLNLFQNARRYQIPDRPVALSLQVKGDFVEVWIEDDGEGIDEENRRHVFDPFFTTSSKGTGLGLAISRKIAREMGGDLYFEPKSPGARFVLVLKPGNQAADKGEG